MLAPKKSPTFNLRELIPCLFLLTLLLAAATTFLVLARMFQSQGDWHQIAAPTDLDPTRPTLQNLTAQDGTHVSVWLTLVNNEWRAYDGITPAQSRHGNCAFGWQPVTNRFEDPCTGAKFELDGATIPQPQYAGLVTTDLVQYPVELRDNQLWVNLDQKIKPTQP